MVAMDSLVTIPEMSLKTGVTTRTIKRDIEDLQSRGILIRVGGRKEGHWEISKP
jgi:ATP-dependent DNA helicase RecG